MIFIVHFKIKLASKISEWFATVDNWQELSVYKEFGLKLQRSGGKFFDSKSDAFINPNTHFSPLAPLGKTV